MSKEIQQFYDELWAWIQSGCEYNNIFKPQNGLCWNCANFLRDLNCKYHILVEMDKQFSDVFGANYLFPFGTEDDFNEQFGDETMYKCPKRLKWIEDHISKELKVD